MFLNRYSIEDKPKGYDSDFGYRVHFITYSLTKFLRRIKFVTDGTFSNISLRVGMREFAVEIVTFHNVPTLYVDVPFDFDLYDKSDDETRCKYYFDLIKQSIQVASSVKKIPVEAILECLEMLQDNNFSYDWVVKEIIDWDLNVKIKLIAELNTQSFILKALAISRTSKQTINVCEVARTDPDAIFFGDIVSKKNIILENGRIYFNSPYMVKKIFYIDIASLLKGRAIVDFWEKISDKDKQHQIRYVLTKLGNKKLRQTYF